VTDQTLPKTTERGNRPSLQKLEKTTKEKSPFLYNARDAAKACGVSVRTWRTWDLLGYIPQPVKIGRSLFWRIEEMVLWIEAGCPHREQWTYQPEKRNLQKLCPLAGRPA
jgi:hypothetical protein